MEDAERVGYVVRNFGRLQGLRYAPYGVAMSVLGVANFLWFAPSSGFFDPRPLASLLLVVLTVSAMVSSHYIGVYYDKSFGRVRNRFSPKKTRLARVSWVAIGGILILSFFGGYVGRIWSGPLIGIAVATFMLGDLWIDRHRLTSHWAFLAALVVGVCSLPVFGVLDTGVDFSLIAVFLGLLFFAGTLLDHLLLASVLKTVPGDGDAIN